MELCRMMSLEAWDGIFLQSQLSDIKNMLKHAKARNMDLLQALSDNPPVAKLYETFRPEKAKEQIKLLLLCPLCNKKLNVSSIDPRSERYKAGFRTYMLCGASCCTGKGCGYENYTKYTKEELTRKT